METESFQLAEWHGMRAFNASARARKSSQRGKERGPVVAAAALAKERFSK
jgi:hypothetical protein